MPGRGHLASGEQIEGRAADWLARLDRAEASAATHADFEVWCRTDPRYLTAYLRLLSVWNRLEGLRLSTQAGCASRPSSNSSSERAVTS
ncbi:MAG: FecR/PupR family sigma factor regulator [Steroidobacteraceae bacterium]